jgi:RNA-directed DNA polymerase
MTAFAFDAAMAALGATAAGVNGPEDAVCEWDAIDWRSHEERVRRLRCRIFTASTGGDLAAVRNLQK